VDKPDKPPVPELPIATGSSHGSVDYRIRAFLNGESHGADVLGALYGTVVNESIPERLRALLKS
jgi:hypothetical protein